MILKGRIFSLVIKEFLTLFRDPKSRIVLIGPPIMQLLVFSFAATLEVKNVSIAIYNQDTGRHGYEILQRLQASPTFTNITIVKHTQAFKPLIDEQHVIAAIHIPQDFSRDFESKQTANLQIILDGRKSNTSQIVNSYISNIVNSYGAEILLEQGIQPVPAIAIERHWFNENLLYIWFTVPSLVGILAGLIALMITALSVARERELGTFDQLLVSPLMPHEILIGKTIPAVLVGLAEGMLIFIIAVLIFGIPFSGSFILLVLSILVFILSVVGIGLFISSLSKTQQQAILGTFLFLVPAVTLSGYASPVENMPEWLQLAVEVNPFKHFLIVAKGIFLKNMPIDQVWNNLWPMLIISAITLSIAGWYFNKRME